MEIDRIDSLLQYSCALGIVIRMSRRTKQSADYTQDLSGPRETRERTETSPLNLHGFSYYRSLVLRGRLLWLKMYLAAAPTWLSSANLEL